jgi:RND family efflux transporter MFP subunit
MTESDERKSPQQNPNLSGAGTGAQKSGHGILIAIIAVLVVIAIVVAGVVPRSRAKNALKIETDTLAVPIVGAIQPKRGSTAQEIVLPGNIQAFIDAPIYARTNGYLKVWYSDIGAHVKKGQLLAEIETPEVDQQLLQARADLNTAQANENLSGITKERFEGLKNTDSVSKQDVDNAEGDYAAKKAIVDSAQSNVGRLQDLQSFQKIYAPFDGVITARNTDVGQLIDSGASGGVAKELFHIAAVRTLRVYINVPQQYSVAAKPGIVADLSLAQFPGRTFQGKLVRTANSIDLASRTLLVEVDVDNTTGELLPGAFTEVHLKLPTEVPTYILPVNTLIFRAQGLQVATVENGDHDKARAKLVTIVLGRDFGATVEVVSGLTDADKVIVSPPDSLVDGEEVKIAQPNQQGGSGSASPQPH